jgi:hypothetical protein
MDSLSRPYVPTVEDWGIADPAGSRSRRCRRSAIRLRERKIRGSVLRSRVVAGTVAGLAVERKLTRHPAQLPTQRKPKMTRTVAVKDSTRSSFMDAIARSQFEGSWRVGWQINRLL